MTTFVGTQSDFSKVLKELAELDYDAIEAYKVAINKMENVDYKSQMNKFQKYHERHIKEINEVLAGHGEEEVTGPSGKQWLTKGKVVLADMVGNDYSILKAMLTNEEDTNTAYERANNHKSKWDAAIEVLKRGLMDEKKHKEWIETNLKGY